MRKEDILEKSRRSGEDEGRNTLNQKADNMSLYALIIIALGLSIYKALKNLPSSDILSLLFVFLSVGMFARYLQDKGKPELVLGLVFSIIALGLLANYMTLTW